MTRPRPRKPTPALLRDTQALIRSLQAQTAVLQAWYPTSNEVLIIVQQLAALAATCDQRLNQGQEHFDRAASEY